MGRDTIDPNYPCCTFRGSITALRAANGTVVWKTYLVDRPAATGKTSVGTPGGGLTALEITDGTRAWFAQPAPCDPPRPGCSPAQPGAVTAIDSAVFSGSMDGHIRAFSTVDGRVLWDYDTARSYNQAADKI